MKVTLSGWRKTGYNMVGVETRGKNTNEMTTALVAKGINAVETKLGSGMIKIA